MPRILIIDDDYSVCEALEAFLIQLGFEAVVAHNGAQGIEEFKQARFDGAIIDLFMPVMNGAEVCAILRQRADGSELPIWIVTSAPTHPLVAEVTRLGVRAVLGKPGFWAQLRAALRQEFPPATESGSP